MIWEFLFETAPSIHSLTDAVSQLSAAEADVDSAKNVWDKVMYGPRALAYMQLYIGLHACMLAFCLYRGSHVVSPAARGQLKRR